MLLFLAQNCQPSELGKLISVSLGIEEDYEHFAPVLITHINTALMVCNQIGVGESGFRIEDKTATWADFVGEDSRLDAVVSYVGLRVKMLFDNSTMTSPLIEMMNRMIEEYEYRLNVAVEDE